MTGPGLLIPREAADLTPSWLTSALRARFGEGVQVASASRQYLGRGNGVIGRLFRVHLQYDGTVRGPASVIVKLPAAAGPIRDLALRFDLYAREATFYSSIAAAAGLPVPDLFHVEADEGGGLALVIEDLAPATAGDLLAGCTLEALEQLIEPIAAFHARWWGDPELDRLDWIPLPNDETTLDVAAASGADAWTTFSDRYGAHLPPPVTALGDQLSRDHTVLDRLSAPPRTLLHGDLRINNVMFDRHGDLRAVIDWQTSLRGRAPLDIARLFVANLHPDDRRVAERRLLPLYHRALRRHGVRGYAYDDCWLDYRLGVINLFGQTVILSALLDIDAEVGDEVGPVTGTRLVLALIDLDLAKLIPVAPRVTRLPNPLRRLRAMLRSTTITAR